MSPLDAATLVREYDGVDVGNWAAPLEGDDAAANEEQQKAATGDAVSAAMEDATVVVPADNGPSGQGDLMSDDGAMLRDRTGFTGF